MGDKMNLKEQKEIKEHFERMYQEGQKPWVEHIAEPALDDFFRLLEQKYVQAQILDKRALWTCDVQFELNK